MRPAARLFAALALAAPVGAQDLVVASKNFTENRVLGEVVAQWIEARTDLEVRHAASLGGTMVCWEALRAGEIDLYVDYTGTGWAIILKEQGKVADPLRAFLHVQQAYRERFDVEWSAPFGLNNTYALALRRELADELGATRISDLVGRGARVRAGFSIEFMNREDGWPGLREHYAGLDLEPRSMEHGLAYEALAGGSIDLVDAYSTDGKLGRFDVVVLEDDLGFFPPYNAAPLVRGEALRAHPELRGVLHELAFTIDDDLARELNARVEVEGQDFDEVARAFLVERGLLEGEVAASDAPPRAERGLFSALWEDRARLPGLLAEHLLLVGRRGRDRGPPGDPRRRADHARGLAAQAAARRRVGASDRAQPGAAGVPDRRAVAGAGRRERGRRAGALRRAADPAQHLHRPGLGRPRAGRPPRAAWG